MEYDQEAALYPGAVFPEENSLESSDTELLLIPQETMELMEDKEATTQREVEALAIAQRIHQMVGKERVLDKDSGTYRPVRYGDIVVLLRTVSGWAEDFLRVFAGQGILAYTASKTGYFSALEVVTALNYLHICDNPLQEIPVYGGASLADCGVYGPGAGDFENFGAETAGVCQMSALCTGRGGGVPAAEIRKLFEDFSGTSKKSALYSDSPIDTGNFGGNRVWQICRSTSGRKTTAGQLEYAGGKGHGF